MTDLLDWMSRHQAALWWLAAVSALMFVTGLILVPVIVARIPCDYFAHSGRPRSRWADQHLVIRGIWLVLKNLAGTLLVVMGIAMLVLPGQGLLSILMGIMLLDFPGKFRLERWFVRRPPVLRSINWLRRRSNRDVLIVDE